MIQNESTLPRDEGLCIYFVLKEADIKVQQYSSLFLIPKLNARKLLLLCVSFKKGLK